METKIKGYELSTNYKKLWALIHKGFRVPAWIVYSDEYKEPIYDLVEVQFDNWGVGIW